MSIANAARPIHRSRTFTAFSQSRKNLKEPEHPERQNPVKTRGIVVFTRQEKKIAEHPEHPPSDAPRDWSRNLPGWRPRDRGRPLAWHVRGVRMPWFLYPH